MISTCSSHRQPEGNAQIYTIRLATRAGPCMCRAAHRSTPRRHKTRGHGCATQIVPQWQKRNELRWRQNGGQPDAEALRRVGRCACEMRAIAALRRVPDLLISPAVLDFRVVAVSGPGSRVSSLHADGGRFDWRSSSARRSSEESSQLAQQLARLQGASSDARALDAASVLGFFRVAARASHAIYVQDDGTYATGPIWEVERAASRRMPVRRFRPSRRRTRSSTNWPAEPLSRFRS